VCVLCVCVYVCLCVCIARGRRILTQLLAFISTRHPLHEATDALLGGCSGEVSRLLVLGLLPLAVRLPLTCCVQFDALHVAAGGLSTLIHLDRLKSLFPSTATVKVLIDGGLFFDSKDYRFNKNGIVDELANLRPAGIPVAANGHSFRLQYVTLYAFCILSELRACLKVNCCRICLAMCPQDAANVRAAQLFP
jgi:hypothetical protein